MRKTVQETLGQAAIEAVATFAKGDLPSVDDLKATHFSHVTEDTLRDALATTFYGARWIYKLGLALLVKDAEQLAHVRTQVVDYAAVCEGLLSDSVFHAQRADGMADGQNPSARSSRTTFDQLIEDAAEIGIVDQKLRHRLHRMRDERNTVHLRKRTYKAFLGTSRYLFLITQETIKQTKAWRGANP